MGQRKWMGFGRNCQYTQLTTKDSGLRPFYVQLFVGLAAQLSKLQDDQGFWHASLLDPDSYPSPETSSTALITYGLAYGLNHHLLDTSYLPVVRKDMESTDFYC
ncbi:MAG: glycoside hydrolase family 88 protein [Phocaeicola vulgatus]